MRVDEIRYTSPELTRGVTFEPHGLWMPQVVPSHPLYARAQLPFDARFFQDACLPIDLGRVEFKWSGPNVLRLPLREPGSKFYLPKELQSLQPLLERLVNYDQLYFGGFDQSFAHVTVDASPVSKGDTHRFPGFHGDGIQGQKLTPKLVVEHSYILTTAPPTEFCIQPFFISHLDEAKHSYFLEMDAQANSYNVYRTLPWHVYLIDPYMVHRSPLVQYPTDRLFIRLTFTHSELDHPKNTENPMLEPRNYLPRVDIRKYLGPSDVKIPYETYGVVR